MRSRVLPSAPGNSPKFRALIVSHGGTRGSNPLAPTITYALFGFLELRSRLLIGCVAGTDEFS